MRAPNDALESLVELETFTEKWFALERRLELFADRSAGIPWWDAIRYRVNEFVFSQIAGSALPGPIRRAWPARTRNLARRIALRAALRLKADWNRYEVLVLRAPRQQRDGRPFDAGLDGLVALCPDGRLIVDTFPLYYHLPRRGSSRRGVAIGAPLDRALEALRSDFGLAWDESELRRLIDRLLADFVMDLEEYRRLLGRVQPRLVLMTQNGLEKALFAAAHAEGVPTVEAQHGLIGYAHPAYSYPRGVDYGKWCAFPSTFLTFSDYWIRSCFYPARRCVSVGNDALFIRPLPPASDPDGVMVVSGDLYTEVLVEWTLRLAAALPGRHIIYKLHPNEQLLHRSIQKRLRPCRNVEVVDGTISASAQLQRVGHVILVQSTLALEALQTGRRLCVLKLLHYGMHQDLFDLPAVTLVSNLEELIGALHKPPVSERPPSFFDPFDAGKARQVLSEFAQPST